MEVAVGERGKDVDPEDGDFLVSWLFFLLGLFSVPLGRFFGYFFQRFSIFCSILGPFFGPKNGPKNGLQIRAFNRIPIVGGKSGAHFWIHFWYPFLGPRI